jgi:hypothetical protein
MATMAGYSRNQDAEDDYTMAGNLIYDARHKFEKKLEQEVSQ